MTKIDMDWAGEGNIKMTIGDATHDIMIQDLDVLEACMGNMRIAQLEERWKNEC